MDHLTNLLGAGGGAELAEQVRALVRAEPLTILRLAHDIAQGDGVVPVDAVTRACASTAISCATSWGPKWKLSPLLT